jgi:hypothetical protein
MAMMKILSLSLFVVVVQLSAVHGWDEFGRERLNGNGNQRKRIGTLKLNDEYDSKYLTKLIDER